VSVTPVELLAGVALDLAFGDPRRLPHPVRGFGWCVERLETVWRASGLPLRLAGALFWATSVAAAAALVWATLPYANIYWIWMLLALRDLDFEAGLVLRRLDARDLPGAREMLSAIVGRDTAHLDEPEILRAAVETVAENLSDAVVAPLFYLALAGPAGMAAYKAVNTLDSMCGYRNERYRLFGWMSARADDAANFIPARLTAALVWICALLPGFGFRRSVRVTLRDGASQSSPNAGYPEAAVAGALGVRLGGLNYYGGTAHRKAYLGDSLQPLTAASFAGARRILYLASGLMVAAVCGVLA
jgi:adenosylcobinamide-phosphate synthase